MGDDDLGLGIHCALDVAADHSAMPGTGCHGAGNRVGPGNLPIRHSSQHLVHCLRPVGLLPDAPVPTRGLVHLLGPRLAFFKSVDAHHFVDLMLNVCLKMGRPAGNLALGEVLVAVVSRLELATVGGDAIALQCADPAAEFDELSAGLADGRAVIAP